MRELHPEVRKFWEKQGEEISVEDNALYTEYKIKNGDAKAIPIARFSKLAEDAKHPDMYWITKKEDELSFSEEVAVRLMKLKAFF